MPELKFIKKHSENIACIVGAVVLAAIMALLVFAFKNEKLPHASDGDAFDTVYAVEQSN